MALGGCKSGILAFGLFGSGFARLGYQMVLGKADWRLVRPGNAGDSGDSGRLYGRIDGGRALCRKRRSSMAVSRWPVCFLGMAHRALVTGFLLRTSAFGTHSRLGRNGIWLGWNDGFFRRHFRRAAVDHFGDGIRASRRRKSLAAR